MSARTILNPPLNTEISGIIASIANIPTVAITAPTVGPSLIANETNLLTLTFNTYFTNEDNVLYTAYSSGPSVITTYGTRSSNPTSSSTSVVFNILSADNVTLPTFIGLAIMP